MGNERIATMQNQPEDRRKQKKWTMCMVGAMVVLIVLAVSFGFYNAPANRVSRRMNLGQKYLEEQKYEQAIVEFNKVIVIDPMNVEAYLYKSEAYIRLNDWQSALETLQIGFDLTGDESLKKKMDSLQAQLNQIRKEEQRKLEIKQEEKRRIEMERNTPDEVKRLYDVMDSADEDEIVRFVLENDIGTFKGAYAPSGDTKNGIVLEMFGEIDWTEFGYTGWRTSYNIYYGEKVDGSYETQGKWYVIWGMAEHVTDKVEYWLYDGEWKGGRPNGSGKLIQIDENYGTYSVNGVVTEEGYAIQKAQTDSAFYNGYVCGDFHRYYEWDIYDSLEWGGNKDIREYKGKANQKAEIIDGEYVKDDSTGEWRKLDGGAVRAGWVQGFGMLCEDITWHNRLERE